MVEKLSINNELILMKKTIAQAKVCVISKLVKKLRDARKQLEAADPKPLKLSTRPAKLAEQIDYLKRCGNVQLAQACLVEQRSAQQVLTNPLASNAEVALAQLAAFKTVAARVAAIKTKYSLEAESAGDWRTAIAEIGKKKQRKTVKEGHLKRKAEQKERAAAEKAAEQKRDEWLEENAAEVGSDGEKDGEESGDQSEEEKDEEAGSAAADSDGDDDELSVESDANSVVEMEEQPQKKKAPKKPQPTVRKPVAPKPKALPVKKPAPTPAAAPEPIHKVAPKRQLDAFFVTSGGSAYMSTGFEARYQPLGPNDGMDRRERRAVQFGKASSSGSRRPAAGGQRGGAGLAQQDRRTPARSGGPVRREQSAAVAPSPPAADLHPSWAAKQRTKGIASFQGSKKTFGDDDDNEVRSEPAQAKPNRSAAAQVRRPTNGGAAAAAAAEVDAAKLHPSWLAKQKLKPVISAFQGKKITFGD